jgi:tetratricopeptide (TPR) repeat protein
MQTFRRTAIAALVAVALVAVAGLGVFRQLRADARDPVASTSALDAPIVPTASLDQTISDLQAHLAAVPDDAHGYAELGLAYSAQATHTGDPTYYPKAEQALQTSLQIQPDANADALIGMGVLANAKHDFIDGVRYGKEALAIEPDATHILGVIGDGQLELGRYPQAFATFQRMVRGRPDIASYARVSYARELQGNIPGALSAMQRALRAAGSPDDAAWVSYQLGGLYLRDGRIARAAYAFRHSEALLPTYVPPHAGLARIAWERGDVDGAIRGYRWVVARLPLPEHVIALGDLYTIAGRSQQANDAYALARTEATLFRANGVNVDVELALFEADHGDAATALADAKAAWAARHSINAADAMAWSLYRSGRYNSAARYERSALHLGTRDALYRYHAAMIDLRLGRSDAARTNLTAALAIDPHFSILYASRAQRSLDRLTPGGARERQG